MTLLCEKDTGKGELRAKIIDWITSDLSYLRRYLRSISCSPPQQSDKGLSLQIRHRAAAENSRRLNLKMMFLKLLKDERAISDPQHGPREKKICTAASPQTCS